MLLQPHVSSALSRIFPCEWVLSFQQDSKILKGKILSLLWISPSALQCSGWYYDPLTVLKKKTASPLQSTQMQVELSTHRTLISNQMRLLDKTATPSRREVLQSGRNTQTPSWHFYPPQNFSCAPYIKHKENHSFVLHFFHGAKDDKQNEVSSKKLLKGPKRERSFKIYFQKTTYKCIIWNVTPRNSR